VDQLETLWKHLMAAEIPLGHPVVWPSLRSVHQECMRYSAYANLLKDREDLRPGCCKNLCAVGMVARAEIEWLGGGCGGHSWSGLFGGETSGEGILRLSSAIAPPVAHSSSLPMALRVALRWVGGDLAKAQLFPCAAFKVPRTGAPSGNLCFAGRKVGQSNSSFFASPIATHLTEKASPLLRPALDIFRRHTAHPTHLGLSDFATTATDGITVAEPRFPWALVLVPTARAAQIPPGGGEPSEAFLEQLAAIPAGTALYDVYAVPNPQAGMGAEKEAGNGTDQGKGNTVARRTANNATGQGKAAPLRTAPGVAAPSDAIVHAGRLVTRSRFVRSAADGTLKFWHQAKEEDYARRPDWEEALTPTHRREFGAEHYARLIENGMFRSAASSGDETWTSLSFRDVRR
jgi:hypothetical protein